MAGVIGNKKFANDIWSDTIKTFNYYESSGLHGKFDISETVYSLLIFFL
ncbi:MAG: hypothetical protein EBS19_04520 [Spirochaetia bacterium]|nr:hypothetical protein [Spirochaetia bacterium]